MPILLALTILTIFRSSHILSAPIPAVEPVYVPGPNGRGTIDLLSTCTITLSLCVWTAIHLNVPPSGSTWWSQIIWAMLAIVAPEVVLWRAIAQGHTARALSKLINQARKAHDEVSAEHVSSSND